MLTKMITKVQLLLELVANKPFVTYVTPKQWEVLKKELNLIHPPANIRVIEPLASMTLTKASFIPSQRKVSPFGKKARHAKHPPIHHHR